MNNQPITAHNSPVTLAIIQLVISDTPLSLATSLLKSSIRHIISLSRPLLHGQMVKIHNSLPPLKKKALEPPLPFPLMLWHHSHYGSLLASSCPPPWLIKLSFARQGAIAKRAGRRSQHLGSLPVTAPGSWASQRGRSRRGRSGAQLAGLHWHLERGVVVAAGAWGSCFNSLEGIFGKTHFSGYTCKSASVFNLQCAVCLTCSNALYPSQEEHAEISKHRKLCASNIIWQHC